MSRRRRVLERLAKGVCPCRAVLSLLLEERHEKLSQHLHCVRQGIHYPSNGNLLSIATKVKGPHSYARQETSK
jgi:uncharacterized protein YbaR (Trm112 family)